MTKYLIPRSDSVSVKIIEPSDFEKYFTSDLVPDYKYSGYTLSGGTGLTVNIASGTVRLKGFVIESTASETVSGLTANDVNYIYVKLARDSNSEAESWNFDKNLSGTAPTDAFYIGTATTNGTTVTSVNQADVITLAIPQFEHMYYGDGTDGDVTISTNTSIGELKKYNNLTINSGVALTSSVTEHASLMIKVKETLTINGTIDMDGKGARGSDGAPSNPGGAGSSSPPGGAPGNSSVAAIDNVNWGWKDTGHTPLGTGTASGAGGGDGNAVPGLKPAPANVRVLAGDKFYVATAMPYMYGAAGTGGASGSSGAAGGRAGSEAGSSGSGGSGGAGGAGGNGGGGIIIMAKNIVFNASGVITSDGADGVDGTQGGPGGAPSHSSVYGYRGNGGFGGGGGEGGQIILLYNYITNNGTITVTAGGAGAAGAAAPASGQGGSSAGGVGVAGSAGASKLIGLGS